MSLNPKRRMAAQIVDADEDAVIAAQSFPDYKPINPAYQKDVLAQKHAQLEAARIAELHAQNAFNAARDATAAAEWELHNLVLGLKTQVIAQYGSDSDQVRALGLKKKSDRRRPTSRSTTYNKPEQA